MYTGNDYVFLQLTGREKHFSFLYINIIYAGCWGWGWGGMGGGGLASLAKKGLHPPHLLTHKPRKSDIQVYLIQNPTGKSYFNHDFVTQS